MLPVRSKAKGFHSVGENSTKVSARGTASSSISSICHLCVVERRDFTSFVLLVGEKIRIYSTDNPRIRQGQEVMHPTQDAPTMRRVIS